jgi:hypothetical protein
MFRQLAIATPAILCDDDRSHGGGTKVRMRTVVSVLAVWSLAVVALSDVVTSTAAATDGFGQGVPGSNSAQMPHRSGLSGSELSGVWCSGLSACIAVGQRSTHPSVTQTLVESWNGSLWAIVPSPNTAQQSNALSQISCSGPSACIAVGYSGNLRSPLTAYQTLVESWNGSTWSIVPSPNVPGTTEDRLNGVSCFSASACAAVGSSTSGPTSQPLFEAWNGSTWTIVPSPPTDSGGLQGVSCSGPSTCTAVGTVENPNFFVPNQLVETWNGASLDVGEGINVDPVDPSSLGGVVCGLSQCFVVGYDLTFRTDQTLIEAWTGSAWTLVSSPTPPSQSAGLSGVSCTSASACTTVGRYKTGSTDETLAESWNGSTWSIVPSPNPPLAQNSSLGGVSCTDPSACTAVGSYDTSTGTGTLVETWDGTAWSIVPSPNADTPVTITSSSLPDGAVGSTYSATLAASGSIPPYVWTVMPGSKLPKGLRLSRAGVIAGQPELAGTSVFKVRVSAASNFGVQRVAEATLSITVT